jgi:hypothetical protein
VSNRCNTTLLALALLLLPCAALGQPTPTEQFLGTLSGGAASPPNLSAGTGPVEMLLDPFGRTLSIDLSFSGLTVSASSAHIHCCATPPTSVGVAVSFYAFPTGVTSGTFQQLFDLSYSGTYIANFVNLHGGSVANAEAALIDALRLGNAYVDIHTAIYPAGEIRAYLGWVAFLDGFESEDMELWLHVP